MSGGKISQYTAMTSPASTDLLDVSQDAGAGSFATKKITFANLLAAIMPAGSANQTMRYNNSTGKWEGSSVILNNGSVVGIGNIDSTVLVNVTTTSLNYAIKGNASKSSGQNTGVYGSASGSSSNNIGTYGFANGGARAYGSWSYAVGNQNPSANTAGLVGQADFNGGSTGDYAGVIAETVTLANGGIGSASYNAFGIIAKAENPADNTKQFLGKFIDGSEGTTGHVITSVDTDGKAKWKPITAMYLSNSSLVNGTWEGYDNGSNFQIILKTSGGSSKTISLEYD